MNRRRGTRDPRRPDILTQAFVEKVKEPGRYGDRRGGFGLSLLVKPDSVGRLSKSWAQRVLYEDRAVTMGLGSAKHVTLKEAKEKAIRNYLAVKDGKDPRRPSIKVTTLEQAMEQAFKVLRVNWKTGKNEAHLRTLLGQYVLPHIGRKAIDQITPQDILAFLTPLCLEKPASGHKLKGFLSLMFKWAVANGLRHDNPADRNIAHALPKSNGTHREALPHAQVGAAVRKIQESDLQAAQAVEFLILTAARSGEVREADWSEVDMDKAIWTIPADRMKAGREHRVPLSDRALETLTAQPGRSGRVFSTQTGRRYQSYAFSNLLRDLGIQGMIHGFRSSFRDWCAENNVDRQLAEAALAHSVGDATERAYFRSDLFDRRRELMQRWADYLARGDHG